MSIIPAAGLSRLSERNYVRFRHLGPLLFAPTYLGLGFIRVYGQGISDGVQGAGRSRSRVPYRATMLRLLRLRFLPLLARREFPKSRPFVRRYADFSDTLHFSGSTLLVALRAGSIPEASGLFLNP